MSTECDGLESSSLSNLTRLWLRFRSETQLIYHCPANPACALSSSHYPTPLNSALFIFFFYPTGLR